MNVNVMGVLFVSDGRSGGENPWESTRRGRGKSEKEHLAVYIAFAAS